MTKLIKQQLVLPIQFFFCLLFISEISGQVTVIYSESFSGASVPNLPSGWSSSTSTALIRTINNANSSGYSGASGGINLFVPNCIQSSSSRSFEVSGISTIGESGLLVGLGHRASSSFNVPLVFEWSSNGSTWNSISSDLAAGTTTTWSAISFNLPAGAENQSNLSFRWSYTASGASCNGSSDPNYRLDDFTITATTLPIELSYFNAGLRDENKIELKWQTQSESNNSYFEIQHASKNDAFRNIGEVNGAGFSNETINYSFHHDDAAYGTNYYRLKQVDFDGHYSFSKIISAAIKPKNNIIIYPTLVSEKVNIAWNKKTAEPISIYLFSQHGKFISEYSAPCFSDKYTIDISDFPSGLYFLKIQDGKIFSTEKIIKK